MSISMKFVPYALALRNVMGKQSYEDWVRSMEKICDTMLENESELRDLVEKTGMDFIEYGQIRKTHMGNTYFFWRRRTQKWQAVFSIYDDSDMVWQTMQRLQSAHGNTLWIPLKENHQTLFPTEFTDEHMLKQALADCGMEFRIARNGDLLCADGMLRFHQGQDGIFHLEVTTENFGDAFTSFSQLDDCYKQQVQDAAYRHLIKQLGQKPEAKLLEERIDADDTIVLTIQVP